MQRIWGRLEVWKESLPDEIKLTPSDSLVGAPPPHVLSLQ